MDRRKFLIAGGGATVALAGGAAFVKATRGDILADEELTRGRGEMATIQRDINSVDYLKSADAVKENNETKSFDKWAQRECEKIGANTILSVVQDRLDESVEGLGRGVRDLFFGPVIAVFHTTHKDRDGTVVSEPKVRVKRLISVAPKTMTITIFIDGQEYTTKIPVGVGHIEVSDA